MVSTNRTRQPLIVIALILTVYVSGTIGIFSGSGEPPIRDILIDSPPPPPPSSPIQPVGGLVTRPLAPSVPPPNCGGPPCTPVPNCDTCVSSLNPLGLIVCTQCCPGFALDCEGSVCRPCDVNPGCTECTAAKDPPYHITCTGCGRGRFLDQNNNAPPAVPRFSCPRCSDIIANCVSCVDADPNAAAGSSSITCTLCRREYRLVDNRCRFVRPAPVVVTVTPSTNG